MRVCEKFNTINEYKKNLAEYSTWENSIKFNSYARPINSSGQFSYIVLDKRERISKTAGKIALGVLGVFAVIFSCGCLLTFKDIRHLFTGREVKCFALEKSLVEQYNNERFSSTKKMQNPLNPLESSLIILDPSYIDLSDAEISVSDDSTDEKFDNSTGRSSSTSLSTSSSEADSDTESSIDDSKGLNKGEEPSIDASFSKCVEEDILVEINEIDKAEKEAMEKAFELKAVAEATSLQASVLLKENIFTATGEGKDILNTLNLVGNFTLMAHHALACTNKKLERFFQERSETFIGKVELIVRQIHFHEKAFSFSKYNKSSSQLYFDKFNLNERISALVDEAAITNKDDIAAINGLIREFDPQSLDKCKLTFKVKCYEENIHLNTQADNLIIQLKEHVEQDVKPVIDKEELEREQNPWTFGSIIAIPKELLAQVSVIIRSAVKAKDHNVIDKIVYYFLENTEYLHLEKDLFEHIEIDSVEKAGIVEKYLSTQIYDFQKNDQNNMNLQEKLTKYQNALL
ncbi:MAG: hypothetical protein H0T62_07210 [Parachlamydiaceae bacterium]|nr:hypothetical protein [Parachlamydiaceae bacterium]